MKKKIKLRNLTMILIVLIVSMLTGCGRTSDGWKVISLEEASRGKENLKVVKESYAKTLEWDSIYKIPDIFDRNKKLYVQDKYIINDIGNGKKVIKNTYTGKEVVVNKDKFGNDETIKDMLINGENAYVIDKYIILYTLNPNYTEDMKMVGKYKEIRWYDSEAEKWYKIQCENLNIGSAIVGYYNDEIFGLTFAPDEDSNEEDLQKEVIGKIFSVNLKTAELKYQESLWVKALISHLDSNYLDENRMIFSSLKVLKDPKTTVWILDFKNRVFSEMMSENVIFHENSWNVLNDTLSPSKDRFFYSVNKDGIISVYVLVIGENGKIKAEGKVFEHKKSEDFDINWDKSGKKLIIKGNFDLDGTPQNYKILEFNI